MSLRGLLICGSLMSVLLLTLFVMMTVGYMPWDGHGKPSHERLFDLLFGLAEGIAITVLIVDMERSDALYRRAKTQKEQS